ncbi:MAG: glycerol-3-phosphate 1-O-acyltransferase PlsY [Clostridia bacterium]|nr:glycerol-3-phosphate 1-O-acyltransferase PlsY [Clostridia bacterium]
MLWKILAVIISYLIGSLNNAIIICKFKNVDIKSVGSGNAGATNTVRALGKKYGIAVFLLDFFKGAVSAGIGFIFGVEHFCAVASIVGHVFPVYFGFKGGKGVSTSYGALAVCDIRVAAILGILELILILTTKIVSLATLISFVLLPVVVYLFNGFKIDYLFITSVILCIMIFFTHRTNIIRLINGTENKFGKKNKGE